MPIYNAPLTKINVQEAKRYAGLAQSKFDERLLQKACLEIQALANIQGSWEMYDYQSGSGEIKASPSVYIKGKKIKQFLNAAEKIVVLSVTIGAGAEAAVTEYFKSGQYAYSLLLDAAATAAVEDAADEMEKTIKQAFLNRGYQLLKRFSPGYGDWDIKFQPTMLSLTKAEKIDVHVTESYMLVPRKSITAVIGLAPNQFIIEKNISCENCTKTNCLARKESHQ